MKNYETIRWLATKITYWGDKLLTFGFYIAFGLFILSWRFIRWAGNKSFNTLKRLIQTSYSAYKDWRMGRRIKHEAEYGIRRIVSNHNKEKEE